MTKKLEFNYIEKEWDRTLSDECYGQLDKTAFDLHLLLVESRNLVRKQEEIKLQAEQAKALLMEEIERVARLVGDESVVENIQLDVRPKIRDLNLIRKSRGEDGVTYGAPYRVSLDYIKIFEMSYGYGLSYSYRKHLIVEYCFLWPHCGCKIYGSLHLHNRDDDVVNAIEQEIGDLLGQQVFDLEFRCPKCQTCSTELDYLCDGFEEDKSLAGEKGKFVWADGNYLTLVERLGEGCGGNE
jgi:hypothetical protein